MQRQKMDWYKVGNWILDVGASAIFWILYVPFGGAAWLYRLATGKKPKELPPVVPHPGAAARRLREPDVCVYYGDSEPGTPSP